MEWEGIENHIPNSSASGSFSGWNIQKLLEDRESLPAAQEYWENSDAEQAYLNFTSKKEDLDKVVENFESRLTQLLNANAKVLRIMAYSKR